ncbi:Uu.00g143760.m01.CDS01 [Anthostomella pinea]|uniref:Uu.00g143760.m01.CDS01 n=1 Tax=Anthostomella pinea TaxID=933095 RepID=A0AAI8YLU2_9PEZI|nr:Uu.00g143760.m01.CDS01 [Anthostomella pinea]
MFASSKTIVLLLASQLAVISATVLDTRGNGCSGFAGVVNGQCAKYYKEPDCAGESLMGEFKTDCKKECHNIVGGFRSINVDGDGTFGTGCEGYSGADCVENAQVLDAGDASHHTTSKAQQCKSQGDLMYSLKCTFKC